MHPDEYKTRGMWWLGTHDIRVHHDTDVIQVGFVDGVGAERETSVIDQDVDISKFLWEVERKRHDSGPITHIQRLNMHIASRELFVQLLLQSLQAVGSPVLVNMSQSPLNQVSCFPSNSNPPPLLNLSVVADRPMRMSLQPSSANLLAHASPMPAVAPVIRTVFPVMSIGS